MPSSTIILSILGDNANWFVSHWFELAISFTLGFTLSISLDFRKYVLNFIKKRKIVNKIINSYNRTKVDKKSIFKFAFAFTVNFFNKNNTTQPSNIDAKPEISNPKREILTPRQRMICKKIEKILVERTSNIFNPESDYEDLVKLKNSDIATAACTAFQLFNQIVKLIEPIDICRREALAEIGALSTVVNGLNTMIQQETVNDDLSRQIDDCENALVNVVNRFPLI